MRHFVCVLGVLLATLASAGSSAAALRIGVAEDAAKGHDDGGASMFAQMTGSGLSVVRMTAYWDETRPTTIVEKAALDRAIPVATARGVQVIMSIAPLHPTSISSTPNGYDLFAQFAALVARTYPQVRYVLVGNEPNQPRFWRPQFDESGARVAAANYFVALSKAYDALKAVDPTLNVVGLGLSERGNNKPDAVSNASTAPMMFLHDLGEAYKASARAIPIMDFVGFHPYPNPSSASDGPDKGMQWPNAGIPNTDRLQQGFWDAFHGTGQPTFAEGVGGAAGVHWIFDESGWQTDTAGSGAYRGAENTDTVSEDTQAQYYAQVIRRYACDARVAMLLFFHWIDETDRDRMQTGLVRADGSFKPAVSVVGGALNGGCTAAATSWSHTTEVMTSSVTWTPTPAGIFHLKAEEDFTWTASVLRVGGSTKARVAVRSATGTGKAYYSVHVKFTGPPLKKGRYAYTVTLRSALNPERTTSFTGKPFTRG